MYKYLVTGLSLLSLGLFFSQNAKAYIINKVHGQVVGIGNPNGSGPNWQGGVTCKCVFGTWASSSGGGGSSSASAPAGNGGVAGIIAAPAPPPPIIECSVGETRVTNQWTENRGSDTIEGVTHVFVKINPFDSYDGLITPQTSEIVTTPLGKYIEANIGYLQSLKAAGASGGWEESSTYRLGWEQFAAGARLAASQGIPDVNVQVSDSNRNGLAKGGGIQVVENLQRVSISTQHMQDMEEYQLCVTDGYNQVWGPKDNRPRTGREGNYTNDSLSPVYPGGYKPNKSYQHRTVRCQGEAFSRATAKSGLNVGNKDFYFSPGACQNGSNAVFKCEVDPTGKQQPLSQAIKENKVHYEKKVDNKFGAFATNEKMSGQTFQFFRNNSSNPVRLDVWFPTSRDSRVVLTESPVATLLTLSTTGTPKGKMFHFEDDSKKVLLSGTDLENNNNTLVLSGLENLFHWRASWATDAGKPHGLNAEFAYKPKIRATVPAELNQDGITSSVDIESVIDVSCQGLYSKLEGQSIVKNRTKEIDNYTPEVSKKFDESDEKALKVSFAKSSSDH